MPKHFIQLARSNALLCSPTKGPYPPGEFAGLPVTKITAEIESGTLDALLVGALPTAFCRDERSKVKIWLPSEHDWVNYRRICPKGLPCRFGRYKGGCLPPNLSEQDKREMQTHRHISNLIDGMKKARWREFMADLAVWDSYPNEADHAINAARTWVSGNPRRLTALAIFGRHFCFDYPTLDERETAVAEAIDTPEVRSYMRELKARGQTVGPR